MHVGFFLPMKQASGSIRFVNMPSGHIRLVDGKSITTDIIRYTNRYILPNIKPGESLIRLPGDMGREITLRCIRTRFLLVEMTLHSNGEKPYSLAIARNLDESTFAWQLFIELYRHYPPSIYKPMRPGYPWAFLLETSSIIHCITSTSKYNQLSRAIAWLWCSQRSSSQD